MRTDNFFFYQKNFEFELKIKCMYLIKLINNYIS
jgi:hypothetical protein